MSKIHFKAEWCGAAGAEGIFIRIILPCASDGVWERWPEWPVTHEDGGIILFSPLILLFVFSALVGPSAGERQTRCLLFLSRWHRAVKLKAVMKPVCVLHSCSCLYVGACVSHALKLQKKRFYDPNNVEELGSLRNDVIEIHVFTNDVKRIVHPKIKIQFWM